MVDFLNGPLEQGRARVDEPSWIWTIGLPIFSSRVDAFLHVLIFCVCQSIYDQNSHVSHHQLTHNGLH